MNLFKGLIKCANCGKNYNYRNDHGQEIFLCSGKKNYGVKFCDSNVIKQNDLIYLIKKHCQIYKKEFILSQDKIKELIEKITIEINGEINIYYKDGKISKLNTNNLIF